MFIVFAVKPPVKLVEPVTVPPLKVPPPVAVAVNPVIVTEPFCLLRIKVVPLNVPPVT